MEKEDHKIKEEESKKSERTKFDAFAHASPDAVIVANSRGEMIYWNDAAERLFGYSPKEIINKKITVIIPERYRDAHTKSFKKVVASGELTLAGNTYESKGLRSDGSEFPIDLSLAKWNVNEELYFGAIIRDVTERKRTEREREALLHDLGERYKELSGLYSISKIFEEPNITMDQILQKTVEVIPPSWQYPEITCGKIIANDKEYKTSNFKQTKWCQSADIIVYGKKIGYVSAFYLKEMPQSFEGPFLREERNLIDAMAEELGRIIERKKAEERIKYMAYHDPLTGLPNKELLEQQFKEIKTASQGKEKLVFIFLELVNYKDIKNTLGSDIANRLVKYICSELQKSKISPRLMARIGEDEFILIIENDDKKKTTEYAESIMRFFKNPISIQKNLITIVANLGIAFFPEDGEDLYAIMQNSDTAMSVSKQEGPYHYSFYDKKMGSFKQRAQKQIMVVSDLHKALEKNEFVLFYQPIVNLESEEIVGAEALIRRKGPEGKLIMPSEFIEHAEKSGLIISISEWLLRDICRQVRKWKDRGKLILSLNINLSAKEFNEPDLAIKLKNAFKSTNLDPSYFQIEITESDIMKKPNVSIKTMKEIRNVGMKVAIDDFGTGYSSLSYLKDFPVDVIKIDKSFIDYIPFSNESCLIVKSIIEIAHALGLKVTAEGVETKEQVDHLRNIKCDFAQGFYFYKPLPAEEFEKLLKKSA